jgi:hypothetical protein
MIVETEIGDAIGRFHSQREQTGGEALATLAELGIGEAIGPIDYADLPAIKVNGRVEAADRCQGYVHDLGLYTEAGPLAYARGSETHCTHRAATKGSGMRDAETQKTIWPPMNTDEHR